MAPQLLKKITTVDPVSILQIRSDSTRNLVIRAAAYDIVNFTTTVPAQKLKDTMIEINNAKQVKVPADIPAETRTNPDSLTGLYVYVELRQPVRIVAANKENTIKKGS